ncbi:hypothetical protein G7046_g2667 [Stylonectria norvegica]|nr:hypothetical protein G7046_g2667 [Stylonectria norvegica]
MAISNQVGQVASWENNAPSMFSLTGRSVIVTGATGGLGLAVTAALLQSGADVMAIDRGDTPNNPSWDHVISIAKKTGAILTYGACDIADFEATSSTFEKAVSSGRFPLRGLVNCAGIGWDGPSINFPINEAKQIIEVNLVGTLVVAQAAAQLVQKHNLSASFVFIASMSGYIATKGLSTAAYSASKAGVHQLTRNLASEWSSLRNTPSIRVNSISPGVIRTPMTSEMLARNNLDEIWTEETMLKRISEPVDYAGPVVFLLSDASSYMTGSDMLVHGGHTAW